MFYGLQCSDAVRMKIFNHFNPLLSTFFSWLYFFLSSVTILSVSTSSTNCASTSCCSRCFSFLSCPHHKINRPRPLLLTAWQKDMAALNPRDVSVRKKRKESKNRSTRTFGDTRLLIWRSGRKSCWYCSQGAVRARTLGSPFRFLLLRIN